jgi:hypothetical protein
LLEKRRMAKRTRRLVGFVPRLWHAALAAAGWLVRHPQPAALLAVAALVSWALARYVQRVDAFRITTVTLPVQADFTLPRPLVGENLWRVDIQALARERARQQPTLKAVRGVRQVPNTLRVDAVPRMPVAQVRLDRWYPVDRDGFILPEGRSQPAERLIRITGCERQAALRTGRDPHDERLQLGLRVAQRLRQATPLIARRVTEINVEHPTQLRLLLDQGDTEVRCGSEAELDAHLSRLKEALRTLARQPFDARYIDVRFHEPVIGPRTSR